MRVEELIRIIDKILPKETAIQGDKLGLQIQSNNENISRVLITYELSEQVISEALELNINCIITFHPLIYFPLANILPTERVGNLCQKLIKNDISLISVHTTFDAYIEGTSRIIADKLGFVSDGFLVPNDSMSGMGTVCHSPIPLEPEQFLEKVHNNLFSPLRFNYGKPGKNIERIAILGGSGSSYLKDALNAGVDAFITADISYHLFHQVNGKMMLVDPGHYEMEQFVAIAIAKLLSKNITDSDIDLLAVSKQVTNPVNYYPETAKYKELQENYKFNENNTLNINNFKVLPK